MPARGVWNSAFGTCPALPGATAEKLRRRWRRPVRYAESAHMTLDGHVVAANDVMARIFGLSREQVLGIRYGETTQPQHMEASWGLYRDVTSGRRPRGTLQKQYRRGDGSAFWGELILAGVRDSQGVIRSTVAMVQRSDDPTTSSLLMTTRGRRGGPE